jgi:hypothetical protein
VTDVASRLVNSVKRRYRTQVDAAADTAADRVDAVLAPEFDDLRRILGDQADAATEVTAAFGRVLARLSADIEALTAEVARLHDRLDRLESVPNP